MKNRTISGFLLAILGALISIAPIFLTSQRCLTIKMRCFATARIELGVGILIFILALFFIYCESKEIRLGTSLSLTFIGIFSALVPTVLLGVCNGSCGKECTCNSASSIIMAILGIFVTVVSFINFIRLNEKQTKLNAKSR